MQTATHNSLLSSFNHNHSAAALAQLPHSQPHLSANYPQQPSQPPLPSGLTPFLAQFFSHPPPPPAPAPAQPFPPPPPRVPSSLPPPPLSSSPPSLTISELLLAATEPSKLSSDVIAQILQLQHVARSLNPSTLQQAGIDAATLATLNAITANLTSPPHSQTILPSPSPSSSSSSTPSPLSSSVSPPPSMSSSSYHIKTESHRRHRDSDLSSSVSKRSRPDSHLSTPTSDDAFSPRRRRDGTLDDLPSDDDGGDSDSDAGSHSTTPGGDAPSSPSSHTPSKRRSNDDDKQRNELQRKRQHQKSDKQRRAKIKDGMEQLKSLVSQHGKLESPDQASIVSASVDLVHSLRSEIAALKQEVDRARGENQNMRRGGGYGQLDSSHLLRGGLGGLSSSSLSQLSQLNQLSSLSQLNSQLSSLSGHAGLSGLNTLNNLNVLSSLGLPTTINSQLGNGLGPQQGGSGHNHSPMPMLPLNSPPPLSMPSNTGSNGFTNSFLSTSPPSSTMLGGYGKDWV